MKIQLHYVCASVDLSFLIRAVYIQQLTISYESFHWEGPGGGGGVKTQSRKYPVIKGLFIDVDTF